MKHVSHYLCSSIPTASLCDTYPSGNNETRSYDSLHIRWKWKLKQLHFSTQRCCFFKGLVDRCDVVSMFIFNQRNTLPQRRVSSRRSYNVGYVMCTTGHCSYHEEIWALQLLTRHGKRFGSLSSEIKCGSWTACSSAWTTLITSHTCFCKKKVGHFPNVWMYFFWDHCHKFC